MDEIPLYQERIKPPHVFGGIPDAVIFPYGLFGVFLLMLAYLQASTFTGWPAWTGSSHGLAA